MMAAMPRPTPNNPASNMLCPIVALIINYSESTTRRCWPVRTAKAGNPGQCVGFGIIPQKKRRPGGTSFRVAPSLRTVQCPVAGPNAALSYHPLSSALRGGTGSTS